MPTLHASGESAYLGQEGVEAQDELLVTLEQLFHAYDDASGVDPASPPESEAVRFQPAPNPQVCGRRGRAREAGGVAPAVTAKEGGLRYPAWTCPRASGSVPPGAQMRVGVGFRPQKLPLGLELLHYLQEGVVDVLVVREPVLHLTQVAERVIGGQLCHLL